MNQTTIYLVRHGSTEYNEKKIFQGHLEDPLTKLTDKGVAQANQYIEIFRNVTFDIIFCSDLGRSKETAEIISSKLNLPLKSSHLLRGKRLGRFEGLPVNEYRTVNKEVLEKFKTMSEEDQWDFKVDSEVESNREVLNRAMLFLNDLVTKNPGKTVLIVTHGGTIRNLLFHFKWAKQSELKAGSVDNVSFIKITHNGQKFELQDVFGVHKGQEIS